MRNMSWPSRSFFSIHCKWPSSVWEVVAGSSNKWTQHIKIRQLENVDQILTCSQYLLGTKSGFLGWVTSLETEPIATTSGYSASACGEVDNLESLDDNRTTNWIGSYLHALSYNTSTNSGNLTWWCWEKSNPQFFLVLEVFKLLRQTRQAVKVNWTGSRRSR